MQGFNLYIGTIIFVLYYSSKLKLLCKVNLMINYLLGNIDS